MDAVRGVMDANGSAGRGGAVGCRAPHLAQKTSAGSTWFPHWLQKGIRNLIRYAKPECSGKLVVRKHLHGRGPGISGYCTANGTVAAWFSHSKRSVPDFPPVPESVIL